MFRQGLKWSGKLLCQTLQVVSWQCSTWQKRNQENGIVAMATAGQMNDTLTNV